MFKTNFELRMKHLKVLRLHNFSDLRNLFSRVPMGNCFWCFSGKYQFICLALRKSKMEGKVLKVILVQEIDLRVSRDLQQKM